MKNGFTKGNAQTTMVSGPNMYLDRRGNLIYYQKRTNTAYRITEASLSQFKTLQMRWVLAFIAFILLYLVLGLNPWLSAGISIALAAFMQWRFVKFLSKLPKSTGFVKSEKVRPLDQMVNEPAGSLLLRTALYLALAVLLVADTFISDFFRTNMLAKGLCFIVAAFAAYMGIKYLMIYLGKKKDSSH